jgi:hypothetical protein
VPKFYLPALSFGLRPEPFGLLSVLILGLSPEITSLTFFTSSTVCFAALNVRPALIEQRERQQAQRQKARNRWREQGFVFTSDCGDNWHPDTVTKVFAELREQAGLPDTIHLHSLRHLFSLDHDEQGHPSQAGAAAARALAERNHAGQVFPFPAEARSTMPLVMEAYIAQGREALEKSRKDRVAPTVTSQAGFRDASAQRMSGLSILF